jgi:putative two-component system response regulator
MIDLTTGLQTIFRGHQADFQQRVTTLESAVAAIAAGELDEPRREQAERDAHKLAGSLGTFGLLRASDLARELELRLAPGGEAVAGEDRHLSACVTALRAEVDGEYARLESSGLPDYHGLTLVGQGRAADASELEADERRAFGDAMREHGLGRPAAAELADGRILVVDDDDAVRAVIVALLTDAGYEARGVGGAREARHALEHERIALLLSDVSMPGETGLDLIRFALCEHPETATLLISALEDPGIAQVAMDFGAYGYLSKPVRRSALLIGVMNALRRREVEARERMARTSLEDILALRTAALTEALERLGGAAAQGRVLQAETIHRWAQSAEYRDPGIGRHLRRVGHYSGVLGARFGLHAESLALASVLHDVGKIALPDSILLKSGPLTADEHFAMQTHAMVGHEMLRDSCSGLLDLAALIAHTHHEKFDGSGYPRGLTASDIALEGRIVAVADVFDALSSDRVYRPAWPADKVMAYMKNERGKHFDPEVLDAFLSSMDEIRSVQSLLSV